VTRRAKIAAGLAGLAAMVGLPLGISQGGGTIDVFVGSTPTPVATPSNNANLWVDTTGGTCARQSSAGAYSDAGACSSLNVAWQAASNGDVIRVKGNGGTYPTQATIVARSGQASPAVTMQAASGETVTIKEMDLDGAAWLTIKDFVVVPAASGGDPNTELFGMKHVHDITVDGVTVDGRFGGVSQSRDLFDINGDTQYVTVENSDIGHNFDAKIFKIQTACSPACTVQNTDTLIDHNVFHDNVQGVAHLECMWLEGWSNLTVSRNHFYDCALNAEVAQDNETGSFDNLLWSQNIMEAADAGTGGAGLDFDGSCAQMLGQGMSNWTFEYNRWYNTSFLGGCTSTIGAQTTWRGNIGGTGDFTCVTGATYLFDVWQDKDCSASDVLDATINDDSQYVAPKALEATGIGDYHYSSCSAGMIGKGYTSSFPATDADRSSRPVSTVDAGPYEKPGC
jgi:hypothetical protein